MRLLSQIMLLAALLLNLPASAAPCTQVRMSGHPNFPPLIWSDYLNMVGAAPELVEQLFTHQGIEVLNDHRGGYNRVLRQLREGSLDINPAMPRNATTEAYIDFIEPPLYTHSYAVIVRRDRHLELTRWEDLIGLRGVAPKDISFGGLFDRFATENLQLMRTVNARQGLKMLDVGRVDYSIYPEVQDDLFVSLLDLEGRFEKMPVDIATFELYIGISKKIPCELPLDALSEELHQLSADGVVAQQVNDNLYKWMGQSLKAKSAGR